MTRHHQLPGYKACIKMLRSRSGAVKEDGYYLLETRAAEFLDRFIADLDVEVEAGGEIRNQLIQLIGLARSPRAVPTLAKYLQSRDPDLRFWAAVGLERLGTKEAMHLLWHAGLHPEQVGDHWGLGAAIERELGS